MLCVVMSGFARLKIADKEYYLTKGSVFFAFPMQKYEITNYENFTYTYLSFKGEGAKALVEEQNIAISNPVVQNLPMICAFFDETVRIVNQSNANYISESALYYAFAFISEKSSASPINNNLNLFDSVIAYINRNYSNPCLSLSEIGKLYFYSEKYISSLIKKNLGVGFSEYLTDLRIKKASDIMKKRNASIAEISAACGFSDPLYFSKVFKKHTGKTPSTYMKEVSLDPVSQLIRKYVYDCD
jgi:YesN/AraC family two-component response regulator